MSKRNNKATAMQPETETAPVETAALETAPVEGQPVEAVEGQPVEAVETAAQRTGKRAINHAVARNFGKTGVAVESVITVLVANPKRGASAVRYGLLANGQTIPEYVAACMQHTGCTKALALSDIAWNLAHKFISVAPIAAAVEAVETESTDMVAHAVEAAESAIAA